MKKNSYTIRAMTRREVTIAIEWAAAEGWNPGLYDQDCFYAADPNGFLIGLLGDEPVATISAVRYGESFGFIGFYIVKPKYRGLGYGRQIWNVGLAYLRDRNIGLDGVIAQQSNYSQSGFKLAYRNIRYQGTGGGDFPTDSGIVQLSTIPFNKICSYDKQFFPDHRVQFLQGWINQPRCVSFGIKQNSRLAGYAVMRICRSGYKVGPLFADSPELAEQLFSALKSQSREGAPVFLDTPEVNSAAIALAKRHEMIVSFETARMYSAKNPDLPLDKIFGVTTFELG